MILPTFCIQCLEMSYVLASRVLCNNKCAADQEIQIYVHQLQKVSSFLSFDCLRVYLTRRYFRKRTQLFNSLDAFGRANDG